MSILTGDNPFADYKKDLEEESLTEYYDCGCEICASVMAEDKKGHFRDADDGAGMTKKGVESYKRENPGSELKTAVTTPPSKLKKGSKAAGRRKSFCARSKSWTGERGKAARRRWNC